MTANLLLSAFMVGITVTVHLVGLAGLMTAFNRRNARVGAAGGIVRQLAVILAVVFGIFALHTIQIWLYAALFLVLGEFSTLEAALYFSTSTFTTVGFGDVYLDETWRLLSAIESANGFLLIGWSTAFLITVTQRLRLVEAEWQERREEAREIAEDAAKQRLEKT